MKSNTKRKTRQTRSVKHFSLLKPNPFKKEQTEPLKQSDNDSNSEGQKTDLKNNKYTHMYTTVLKNRDASYNERDK